MSYYIIREYLMSVNWKAIKKLFQSDAQHFYNILVYQAVTSDP